MKSNGVPPMETTTARDIMSTELITLRENATLEEAVKVLINNRITGLPVVDGAGKMIGVLSEYDIIRQVGEATEPPPGVFQDRIEFSKNPVSLPPDAPIETIIDHFVQASFRRIPIVDSNGCLIGIITRRDLMKLFFYRAKLP